MSDKVKWPGAGAEGNYLIARYVTGWELVLMGPTGIAGGVDPNSDYPGRVPVPLYTTTWEGMGKVVEKMDERQWAMAIENSSRGLWDVVTWDRTSRDPHDRDGTGARTAYADTAPEAVGIAALRACGVEVET